jgi:predicted dehydrogenase/threonine dehydrogenase-like Zn-dependent dehydrogenase
MKQLFIKKGKLVLEDLPLPVCGDNEVLVSNFYSLISSGTELASIKNRSESPLKLAKDRPDLVNKVIEQVKREGLLKTLKLVKSKLTDYSPLGYSSAGVVMRVGKNVTEFVPGDKVACGGNYANHAEIISVPKNLVVKMPEISFEDAAFVSVGAIALQGVRRAQVQIGDKVVVLGLGLVGLLTVQILKAAGCKVIGLDINVERCNLAKKLGANFVLNSSDADKIVKLLGLGADSVIITAATKSSEPAKLATKLCRRKGRVVVVGDVGLNFERKYWYEKELDIVMSTSYGPGRYDTNYEEKSIDYPIGYVRWTLNRNMSAFLDLVRGGKVDVRSLIGKIYSIEEAEEAYAKISESKIITAIFRYQKDKTELKSNTYEIPKKEGKINLAVIGAGNFVQTQHLPNLQQIPDFNIRAIVTATPINAKKLAEQYKAQYFETDYRKVLADPDIDAVLIATRHNLHTQIAIDAAKAKKHIFLEKPICVDDKDLKGIFKTVKENNVACFIGFNRKYSQLSQKVKDVLGKKNGPWIINYVVNAGQLPKNSWIYDTIEGGGRCIGEACHFFDFFNFIINVDVQDIKANASDLDNFIATIKYKDGSLANLIYNSIGSSDFPKERVEIFRGGAIAIINDYKELQLYGTEEKGLKLGRQDKGSLIELQEFAKLLKGRIKSDFERSVKSMQTTFDVDSKIKGH